jgi:putative thioredoxin
MTETPDKLVATFENFSSDVVEESDRRPVLVDFWAPWCGPCQTLLPILDRLADEYAGRFLLAKVNTDEQPQIAGHFGIRSLPTVMLLHRREIVEQWVGVQPERTYRQALDSIAAAASEPPAPEPAAPALSMVELEAALAERPRDAGLLAELARLQLEQRSAEAAGTTIDRLAEADPADPRLARLRAVQAFTAAVVESPDPAAVRHALESNPADSAARHALAAHHALAGDYATALSEWLELMRRDRRHGDDVARRSLLLAFGALGEGHELVTAYRRKMANLLH